MKHLTDNWGKKIIAIETGKYLGYALNVCVDTLKYVVTGYVVCDERYNRLNFIAYQHIKSFGDFLTVENENMLEFGENVESFNPIQKQVVSIDGFDLGIVKECFCEKNKITKIITNKCEINAKNINLDGEILIFSKNKKNRKNNLFFTNKKTKEENIVSIQKTEKIQLPYKTNISTASIIGKISTADIFGINNEIIARKNQQITEKIVKNAKKHNKLNLLMFNCK